MSEGWAPRTALYTMDVPDFHREPYLAITAIAQVILKTAFQRITCDMAMLQQLLS